MPPQVAGNTTAVQRAPDLIDASGTRRPGRWTAGGMWVRGLCFDCNNRAGRAFDLAYADFANQVSRLTTPTVATLQVIPSEPPGVGFAPGLTARSVLFGMFAINPRLRVIFPELAYDLAHGVEQVRWPDKVTLRVGRTHRAGSSHGLLTSGIWMIQVLGYRMTHSSFADVVFPPLAWSLIPNDTSATLGPEVTEPLTDASDWVRYSPERTTVDLRNLTRTFPEFLHPMLRPTRDNWVEMLASDDENKGTAAVVVYGRLP